MKTFVLMIKLTASDARPVEIGSKHRHRSRSGRAWLDEIQQACPEIRFLDHYALMGYWDSMHIYESPDEESAAKVSMMARNHGAAQVETWLALPYERVLAMTDQIRSDKKEEE